MRTIEHCKAEDVGIKPKDITNAEHLDLIAIFDDYLKGFAPPEPAIEGSSYFLFGRTKCPNCNESLDGMMGRFTWGLAHGEGKCAGCGWPARGIHRIPDRDGTELAILNQVLAYHPDVVETVKTDSEES